MVPIQEIFIVYMNWLIDIYLFQGMGILCVIFMQAFNTAFSPFSYMVVKGPFMMEEASKIFSFLVLYGLFVPPYHQIKSKKHPNN